MPWVECWGKHWWRPVFYLAAIPGFIVAAIIWFLPEPQKGQSDYQALEAETAASASKAIPTTSTLSELLAVPTLVVVYVVGTLISFTVENGAGWGQIFWRLSIGRGSAF